MCIRDREDGGEFFRSHGLFCFRIQRGEKSAGDIGGDIIPLGGHFIVAKYNLLYHDLSLYE
jgi:hypothetical protein